MVKTLERCMQKEKVVRRSSDPKFILGSGISFRFKQGRISQVVYGIIKQFQSRCGPVLQIFSCPAR